MNDPHCEKPFLTYPNMLTMKDTGVGPITQLRTWVIKNSNIQGRSPNVVKVIYHTIRNCI